MSRFRRLRSFSLAFPLLLAPLAAAAQAPHYGYSPHFCQTWSHPASENVENNDTVLGAVTAVSASNLWAVGNSFDGTARHTLAENWNGAAWTIVPTPDGSQPNSLLTAVDSRGPNVWAVGFSASANPFDPQSTTLVEKWNGTGWELVPSPNPTMPGGGESTDELYGVGVAGSSDVWVVGKTADFTTSQSLILHWDGLEWTDFSTPDDGDAGWLTAVEVVAPDDVWAVGFDSVNFLQVNLIKHWNGQTWTNVVAPNVGPFVNQLQSVSATSRNDVWAVGYHQAVFGTSQVNQTSVLHWNGSAWSVVDSPNNSQLNNYLFGVAGLGAVHAWAVGFWDNGTQLLTMIQHWDGLTWSVVPSTPDPSDAINELTGIVIVGPNDAWAVGQDFGLANWETLTERLACPGMLPTRFVTR
jgi:hypothetical protein